MVPTGIPNRQKASVSTSSPSASFTSGMRGNHTDEAERVQREDHLQREEAGAFAGHVGTAGRTGAARLSRMPAGVQCGRAGPGLNSVRRCGRMRNI